MGVPMQPLENLAPADLAKLAVMVHRFNLAWEQQQKRDGEIVSALVRVLRNPGGVARVEVDAFRQLLREFQQEDSDSIVSTEAEILRRCDVDETKATELRKRRFSEASGRSRITGKMRFTARESSGVQPIHNGEAADMPAGGTAATVARNPGNPAFRRRT
jgi:hypothetical protein